MSSFLGSSNADTEAWIELSSSSKASVYKYEVEDRTLVLKRFYLRGLADFFKHQLRRSRAVRADLASSLLKKHSFQTPLHIQSSCKRRFGFVVHSELLSEFQEGSTVREYLRRPAFGPLKLAERREMLRALGLEVGRMHHVGIFYGDLNPGNVIIRQTPSLEDKDMGKRFSFVWLDYERCRSFSRLPWSRRFTNLRQLAKVESKVSRSDYARFWMGYSRALGLEKAGRKLLALRVLSKLDLKHGQNSLF